MPADTPAVDRPVTTSARSRWRDVAASTAVVLVLAVINVTGHLLHPPWWVGLLEATALLVWARLAGLSWDRLGLGRDRLPSGVRWGLAAIAVVAAVYAAGLLIPLTRPAFQDVRYDLPVPDALRTVFVTIPFGTVLLEELAFRSVLWGFLSRHCRPWQVLLTTSVLFGFWHVIPALDVGATNRGVADTVGGGGSIAVFVGAIALTTVGGLVFGELRRRSGSVLAAMGAHWAFNALGVLFGLLAWRLDPAGG
jgi:membrane protease YdiL (CAAX protease family)